MPAHEIVPDTWRLVELAEIDSTNAELLRRAASGESEGLAVRADLQTAGRGRRGREWSSPRGNLYLSILIDSPLKSAGQAGFAVALALVETIEAVAGKTVPQLRFKWPNDLLYGEMKVAGLLLEGVPGRDQVVAGVGLNLVETPVSESTYPVGTLKGYGLDVGQLAQHVCEALADWLNTWRTVGFAPVRRAWLESANGIGGPIVVRLPNDRLEGTFKGLADDGALLLDQGEGRVKSVSAGDVFFGAVA